MAVSFLPSLQRPSNLNADEMSKLVRVSSVTLSSVRVSSGRIESGVRFGLCFVGGNKDLIDLWLA